MPKKNKKTEKTENKVKEQKQGAKEKNEKMENYGLNIVFLRRMIRLLTSMMGETMAILFFILLFVFAIGYEVMTIDKERDSWRDIYFVLKEKWYGGGWRRFITCGGRGSKRESGIIRPTR